MIAEHLETDDPLEDFLPPVSKINPASLVETEDTLEAWVIPDQEEVSSDHPLASVFQSVGPRPSQGSQADKKNYSEKLSRALSQRLANTLRPHFEKVAPGENGKGHETELALPDGKTKRVDVLASSQGKPGVILSVKTISFADARTGRFTKNVANRAGDMDAEARALRDVAPAVGLLFLPAEACHDGNKSSFAHTVDIFRHHNFTAMLIAVYEHEGEHAGHVRFFQVFPNSWVEKKGLPRMNRSLSLEMVSYVIARSSNELYLDWRSLYNRDWICVCGHEFRDQPEDSKCPKCSSEDIFLKNDGLWPCKECRQPGLTHEAMVASERCDDCLSRDDTPMRGL